MNYFLTGAGHFGFGFLVGTCLLLVLLVLRRRQLSVQLYAPFLPFFCGFFSVIPYVLFFQKTCLMPAWSNVFFLYSWVHCQSVVVNFLGNIHVVGLICGVVYSLIILRYISLVKHLRRYGWKGGV